MEYKRNYLNHFKNYSHFKGERTNELLLDMFLDHPDIKVLPSTEEEDMFGHIDFRISYKGKVMTVDVKSIKDLTKRHPELFTWIEFKNVNGDDGWVLGKVDYICFELKNYFLMIPRKTLLEYCKQTVNFNEKVDHKLDCRYNLYGRHDRKDLLTVISLVDLVKKCPDKIFKLEKPKNYLPEKYSHAK